jgi:hypothetical protein
MSLKPEGDRHRKNATYSVHFNVISTCRTNLMKFRSWRQDVPCPAQWKSCSETERSTLSFYPLSSNLLFSCPSPLSLPAGVLQDLDFGRLAALAVTAPLEPERDREVSSARFPKSLSRLFCLAYLPPVAPPLLVYVVSPSYISLTMSRDSSVVIATGYGLDDQWDGSSGPGRVKNFHFSISSRPALGCTQPPIKWVPGSLSRG